MRRRRRRDGRRTASSASLRSLLGLIVRRRSISLLLYLHVVWVAFGNFLNKRIYDNDDDDDDDDDDDGDDDD